VQKVDFEFAPFSPNAIAAVLLILKLLVHF